jgi:hypothetical protein
MGFLTPATAVSVHPRSRAAGERKGVLLLVVLSMLTLFLMLGSTYLVIALRAKKVSHAFSKNIDVARTSQEHSTRYVDEAFFTFVRGTNAPRILGLAPDDPVRKLATNEDLLGDKYGQTPPATGEITAATIYRRSPQFIEITTSNVSSVTSVSELPGRVITLRLPRLNVSTRVLHAEGVPTAPTIVIAAVATVSGRPMTAGDITAAVALTPTPQPPHFIINGREFDGSVTNERFDAYGDSLNPLLSRIAVDPDPAGGGIPELTLAPLTDPRSYSSMASPPPLLPSVDIDNDNDGIRDSAFLDIGLAPFMDAAGLPVFPKAAVLVVDLDGRLNLNAHDSAVDEETYDTAALSPMYPDFDPGTGPIPVATLPRGPAGVAGISIRKADIFPSTSRYSADNEFLSAATVNRGVSDATTLDRRPPTAAPSYPVRPTPGLGGVEGRYGGTQFSSDTDLSPATLSAPGAVGINDGPSTDFDRWLLRHFPLDPLDPATLGFNWLTAPFLPSSSPTYLGTPFAPVTARYGTPPDPKGRMRIWIDPASGAPVYYTPFWDPATRGLVDDPLVDDPYEVNLTKTASRLAVHRHSATTAAGKPASDNVDGLYSPSDLEGILRYLETDSPRLSRRLVSLMGDSALDNRHLLTTESWDTTAIVGPLWENVIRSPFSADLNKPIPPPGVFAPGTPSDPYFLLSRESRMGHKFDVNRPFHDADISEPYWEDKDGDGIPDVFTGEQRRQAFARQLYVLFRAIVEENNPATPPATPRTLPPEDSRALAQYAVNIVDFRDADSTMTKFDFDPTYVVGGTWNPAATETVWGCERPDLVITETFAWHDRRTDDLSAGGGTVETPSAADDDFDQKRRPRGAFFVELTNPWGSFAAEYDPPSDQIVPKLDPGSGTYSLRGDPIPEDLADLTTDRFATDAVISLDARSDADAAGDRYPVWRLASVRGKVSGGTAFGADTSYAGGSTEHIVDPANPTSTAVVDRIFYFAPPPLGLNNEFVGHPAYAAGTPGAAATNPVPVFWQVAPGGTNPAFGRSVVVGTDAPINPALSGASPPAGQLPQRFFSNDKLPGTLTEPAPFDPSVDAYVQLNGGTNYSTGTSFDDASWGSPVDQPLDAATLPPADFAGKRLDDVSGNPLLMLNGTHANFAVVHLQRLADPKRPWDKTDNPYLTVDSLPVDLNVINTNAAGQIVDEPGATPTGGGLAYLRNQLAYRGPSGTLATVERGGNHASAPKEENLWSSRVNTDAGADPNVDDVQLPNAFQSDPTVTRPATPLNAGKLVPYGLRGLAGASSLLPTDTPPSPTRAPASAPFPWMFFPNRPYDSVAELSLVPTTSAFHLLKKYTVDTGLSPEFFHLPGYWESATPPKPAPAPGDPPLPFSWHQLIGRETGRAAAPAYPGPPLPGLLDFLHVPSRFSAVYATVPDDVVNDTAMTALGLDQSPTRQLSHFREPGRVNVNTITDQKTWRALFGGLDANGDVSSASAEVSAGRLTAPDLPRWGLNVFGPDALPPLTPPERYARNILDFFGKLPIPTPPGTLPTARNAGDPDLPPVDEGFLDNHSANYLDTDRNPYFRYQTMSQLTERVSTRSNVFAIWVTVGYFQGTTEVLPRSRGFFIFDRSIPVAYEKGKNHNVEDAVLLRRVIH